MRERASQFAYITFRRCEKGGTYAKWFTNDRSIHFACLSPVHGFLSLISVGPLSYTEYLPRIQVLLSW